MTHARPPDADQLTRHAAFLRAVARATLRGDDLVDDVVQEAWVAALRGGRRRGPLAPWLAGIARNQARNLLRRRAGTRRRERAAARDERRPAEQEAVERLEIERRLLDAVEALPEAYRTPLVLRYLEDLPPRVIAVRMDLPVATVRTRVRRALERLRNLLEERHGEDARTWRLALLAVAEPARASPPTPLAAMGGILMVKKLLLSLIALAVLAAAAFWLPRAWRAPSAATPPDAPAEHARAAPDEITQPAGLVGRPPIRDEGERSAAPPEAVREGAPAGEASEAQRRRVAEERMNALLADIRREVAPDWWRAYGQVARLEAVGATVIARGPDDVLDQLADYLDARRREQVGAPETPPEAASELDPEELAAVREELRPILRGMAERERTLARAFAFLQEGRKAEAEALGKEVLAAEPDNRLATEIVGGVASETTRSQLATMIEILRGQSSLADWTRMWWSATTRRRLVEAGESPGRVRWSRLAPDLDALLGRGTVTLALPESSLAEAVRALQIETFADIRVDAHWKAEAAVGLVPFQLEARSLEWALDELVRRLPEGWRWERRRNQILVTRDDAEDGRAPETSLQFFSVNDLVVPGYEPQPAAIAPSGAPMPPQYRIDPEGGPPVPVRPHEPDAAEGR